MEILKCENVRKVYGSGNNQVVRWITLTCLYKKENL